MSLNTISPARLNELCRSGRSVDLIDVRTSAEYGEVHAAIARNVPLDELDPAAVIKSHGGAGNYPLYLICKVGGRSAWACELFINAGFLNVVNVEGGTDAWVEAGLPVVRGEKTISPDRQIRVEQLPNCSN